MSREQRVRTATQQILVNNHNQVGRCTIEVAPQPKHVHEAKRCSIRATSINPTSSETQLRRFDIYLLLVGIFLPGPGMPRSPQVIYARHLVPPRGYPLWTPEPSLQLLAYRRDGLRIGNVGIVIPEDRCFDVFFNICLSRDHPFHQGTGVPDNFNPIELCDMETRTVINAENGRIITTSSVKTARIIERSRAASSRYVLRLPTRRSHRLLPLDNSPAPDHLDWNTSSTCLLVRAHSFFRKVSSAMTLGIIIASWKQPHNMEPIGTVSPKIAVTHNNE